MGSEGCVESEGRESEPNARLVDVELEGRPFLGGGLIKCVSGAQLLPSPLHTHRYTHTTHTNKYTPHFTLNVSPCPPSLPLEIVNSR